MAHSKLLLVFLFILSSNIWCKAQESGSAVAFQLGGGPIAIISNGSLNSTSYSLQTSIGIKNIVGKNYYTLVGIGYNQLKLVDFSSRLYDPMLVTDISMVSTINQSFVCFPLVLGYSFPKLNLELEFNLKYLFISKLSSSVENTDNPNIPGKYEANNQSNIGEYPSFNYGIGPKIEYKASKNFSVFYRLSYDLEVNPSYSYLNTYNTLNNHVGFTIYLKK